MLYKKIHRQHVREFRVGRRFKWYDGLTCRFDVYEVTGKPHIDLRYGCISVKLDITGPYSWILTPIADPQKGIMDHINWLED